MNNMVEAEEKKIKMVYDIQTPSGIYKVKRPVGRYGAKHFSLLAKSMPAGTDEDGKPMVSPGDQDRFSDVFVEWSAVILPSVLVSGPYKYEEMPGEDQYGIFLALFQIMNMGEGELFRVLD